MAKDDLDLFKKLGFEQGLEEKKSEDFFNEDKKPKHTIVYSYEAKKSPESSFYFFSSDELSEEDLKNIHSRVWNENKVKLYFTKTKEEIKAYPAFTTANDRKEIYSFSLDQNEKELIESINKNKIETGFFWINVLDKLKKRKIKTVHEELIEAIERLRDKLGNIFSNFSGSTTPIEVIIQALIDRTLFIKFLEDRHIINSYFYTHYFGKEIKYKDLLEKKEISKLNKLFKIINQMFGNILFEKPNIPNEYLTNETLDFIFHTISATGSDGQLSLFDFEFDIMPIEFIGHIYQASQKDKKKEEGIVYTPENLAGLLIDKVIGNAKNGKVLDPACGSGVFLVLALRRLIQNQKDNLKNIEERLNKRFHILSEKIFGIEKSKIAWRITIFSLYLELFNEISPKDIKNLIIEKIEKLKNPADIPPLITIDISKNILSGNSLDTNELKFQGKSFDFILGNPPWKKIENGEDEDDYWKKKKDIVGSKQLSQLFILKLSDWQNESTRFGFVLNSSNFYNENSQKFRNYFFGHYKIEEYYDLSNIKDILFKNASEPACAIVFSNPFIKNNSFPYYSFEFNSLSKLFDIVFIDKTTIKEIAQDELKDNLLSEQVEKKNLGIISKLENKNQFSELINYLVLSHNEPFHRQGLGLMRTKTILEIFNKKKEEWDKYDDFEKDNLKEKFYSDYLKNKKDSTFNIPYIKPTNIDKFILKSNSGFLSEKDRGKFYRPGVKETFINDKIIYTRIGDKLKSVFNTKKIFFNDDFNVIKLSNKEQYHLINAILNSKIIDYFINLKFRKRIDGSFPKVSITDINKIPIPINQNPKILKMINQLSQNISDGKTLFNSESQEKLDELIFDLYGLNIIEKDIVNDFFITKSQEVTLENLKEYWKVFYEVFRGFLKKGANIYCAIHLEENHPIKQVGIQIKFDKNDSQSKIYHDPEVEKTMQYLLDSIFENIGENNFITLQNKIFANNSVYIIRENLLKNWSKSKAVEDANDIIRRFLK